MVRKTTSCFLTSRKVIGTCVGHHDSSFTNNIFLFSTESTQAKEPTLQRSGRYAHPPLYIEEKLKDAGFTQITYKESLLRKDGEHWIEGMIWMAQK